MTTIREQNEVPKAEEPVKKTVNVFSLNKDLQDFKEEMRGNTDKILDILEKKDEVGFANINGTTSQEPQNVVSKAPNNDLVLRENETIVEPLEKTTALNHKHQAIFEEYFDPADGFTAELNLEDNIEFSIIVPMELSNGTDAWKQMHKIDNRMIVLKSGAIESGMREWCQKVCSNLKYDKNAVRK